MTTAIITKTLNKLSTKINNNTYSLGFNRLSVLPVRVRRALDLSIYLETGSTDTHSINVSFFENMTEEGYVNYLKLA